MRASQVKAPGLFLRLNLDGYISQDLAWSIFGLLFVKIQNSILAFY